MLSRTIGPVDVLVTGWLLLAIAAAVIIARLYLRLKIQNRSLIWSDSLMCAAWVVAAIATTSNVIFSELGALQPGLRMTLKGQTGTFALREHVRLLM
ncbi:hypothetical protein G7Z17_g7006 [Cylindrodendrum hubeiense]|uniref:Uncharacterized protein n=1 Tax=Cylindrodendrum hubeiense TaxID=595255 RepID=A0A9P5LEL6_9HYPO|nr:hypothetical protein G7Z17_g7006 [Cylindrodendrum hubeiense]